MYGTVKSLIEASAKSEKCCGHSCEVTAYSALNSLTTCDGCSRRFCKRCIQKYSSPLPEVLIRRAEQRSMTSHNACNDYCKPLVINYYMQMHRDEMRVKYQNYLDEYLSAVPYESQRSFYDMPTTVAQDTAYRYALRVAKVAEVAATVSGYSIIFQSFKYAYYGTEVVNQIIAGDLLTVLGPVRECLDAFGINGPTGLLNSYYLGCQHVLDYKIAPDIEETSHRDGLEGIIAAECPQSLLDIAGRYVGPASWLYATLPAPHDDNEWSSWYLTRLVHRSGWTVIACVNETTKLPDGTKCPAFALLVRRSQAKNHFNAMDCDKFDPIAVYLHRFQSNHSGEEREAILAVRGTASMMDWSINLNETPDPFLYYTNKPSINHDYLDLQPVEGSVHRGMHQGAMAILDSFAMRQYLTMLSLNGYAITMVGHSLGGGVAAILAAELQNGFRLSSDLSLRKAIVRAVCYASPPSVTAEIADAIAEDGLVLNCINWNDVIPRFSRKNVAALASEVISFAGTDKAELWRAEDIAGAKAYAASIGKAADIHQTTIKKASSDESKMDGNSPEDVMETIATLSAAVESVPIARESMDVKPISVSSSAIKPSGAIVTGVVAPTIIPMASAANSINAATTTTTSAAAVATATTTTSATATVSESSRPSWRSLAMNTVSILARSANNISSVDAASANSAVPTKKDLEPGKSSTVESKDSDKLAKSMVTVQSILPVSEGAATVLPGLSIQFYERHGSDRGSVGAAVIDYKHRSLGRILLLLDRILDRHRMDWHLKCLRAANTQFQLQQMMDGGSRHSKEGRPLPYLATTLESFSDNSNAMANAIDIHDMEPMTASKNSIEAVPIVNPQMDIDGDHSIRPIDPETQPKAPSEWKKCSVCALDVNWPFILKSDANRAWVGHHCGACGRICCCYCAPAADKVPGEGFNSTITLPDWRMSFPLRGNPQQQRVCAFCYMDSYDII